MSKINLLHWASLVLFVPILACTTARQTPEPRPTLQQLAFDIQTATPTVSLLFDAPTPTLDPNATPTSTPTLTPTLVLTATVTVTPTETIQEEAAPPPKPTR